MQRFVVSRFFLNSSINHSFKSKFTTSFYHSNKQDTLVKIFLLSNFISSFGILFKSKLTSIFTPSQQILVASSPVFHHSAREFTRNNIIHVLLIKRSKQLFNLLRNFVSLNLCRVRKTVHHICNSAPFKSFTYNIPAVHKEFCSIFRRNTFANHLVITNNSTSLKHTAKNCLLAHKVTLYLGNK